MIDDSDVVLVALEKKPQENNILYEKQFERIFDQ